MGNESVRISFLQSRPIGKLKEGFSWKIQSLEMRIKRIKSSLSPTSFSFTVLNRTLKFTREGTFFVILVIGIGFGAINTGINLLYLILAMCLSFIIVSGILSEITLRHVSVTRTFPKEIFAEQSFPVKVEIKNNKKWFPSYSVWIEEDIDSKLNIPKLYFYNVKAGEFEKKNILWALPQRGLFKTNGIKVSTRYPFGFFIKTALLKKAEERVVFPAIKSLDVVSEQLAGIGESSSGIKGEGSDIFGFRGFSHGDSSRMIHWKTSAKVDNLMIKEHFKEESRKIAIMYDNRIGVEKPEMGDKEVSKKFEDGVSQAASLASHFIEEGCQVKMVTHSLSIPFGSSFNHLNQILYHLALLEPVKGEIDLHSKLQESSGGCILLSYAGEYL